MVLNSAATLMNAWIALRKTPMNCTILHRNYTGYGASIGSFSGDAAAMSPKIMTV